MGRARGSVTDSLDALHEVGNADIEAELRLTWYDAPDAVVEVYGGVPLPSRLKSNSGSPRAPRGPEIR